MEKILKLQNLEDIGLIMKNEIISLLNADTIFIKSYA